MKYSKYKNKKWFTIILAIVSLVFITIFLWVIFMVVNSMIHQTTSMNQINENRQDNISDYEITKLKDKTSIVYNWTWTILKGKNWEQLDIDVSTFTSSFNYIWYSPNSKGSNLKRFSLKQSNESRYLSNISGKLDMWESFNFFFYNTNPDLKVLWEDWNETWFTNKFNWFNISVDKLENQTVDLYFSIVEFESNSDWTMEKISNYYSKTVNSNNI